MKTPAPDSKRFIRCLMGQEFGRPPLVEYLVDEVVMRPIVEEILNRKWINWTDDRSDQKGYLDNFIAFWYGMGYDFVRFEQNMGFPTPQKAAADTAPNSSKTRMWAEQHHGMITSWQDFERYPWPKVEDFNFFAYEYIHDHLPEGMGLIVSHAAGMFEHLSQIMSYEGLCLALHDQPDLVAALAQALGERMVKFYEHVLDLDHIIALFPGDDMGFRSNTLVAPRHLRQFVFPWHKRFVSMAHQKKLPYFLHSCGNLASILDDLIIDVGIDGKHSFEDAIIPIERFQEIVGRKIAVLGGIDINLLANGTPDQIRRRVRELVETCGTRGRYAIGSGNSIPSYIPVINYLAMLDEAKG